MGFFEKSQNQKVTKMDGQYINRLFQIIKNDDVKKFDEVITDRLLSLCLGRFPILSLCYMYESFIILAKYEKRLKQIKIDNYVFDEEPVDIYFDFKEIAGKALRFYPTGSVVTPLEMLCILGKDKKVSSEWNEFDKNSSVVENVEKICSINFETTVEANEEKITMPKLKSRVPKKIDFLTVATAICLCFAILCSCSLGVLFGVIGTGSKAHPFKVDSLDSLVKNAEGNVILKSDVYAGDTFIEKVGSIDGNGKTIYLENYAFVKNLTGSISNVTFVIKGEFDFTNPNASIVETNDGEIKNVRIVLDIVARENDDADDFYISALVGTNNGTIADSSVTGNATITGNASGNAYFASFASINNGTIKNCKTENGSVVSENIDLSGIASENNGTITETTNSFSINQTATADFAEDDNLAWNPNGCGITMTNNGVVKNSANYGEIKATSLSDKKYQILVAGIAINNSGTIVGTNNYGEIFAESENCSIYAGGIVSFNKQAYDVSLSNFIFGTLTNCRNSGKITTNATGSESAEILSGGIVGVNQGKIEKSANDGEQVASVASATPLIGGIAGLNTTYTDGMYTSFSSISESRSDTKVSVTVGNKQTFVGGLVANNQSTLQYSFAFCSFTVVDNNEYESEDQRPLVFLGTVVAIDNISQTVSGWSSPTAYNSGFYSDSSVSTIGAFVYQNGIVRLEDGLNYGYTNRQSMINALTQQGRYWE